MESNTCNIHKFPKDKKHAPVKFYLAYHDYTYPFPHSKELIPIDVNACRLDSNYFSELSMVQEILDRKGYGCGFIGVGHYRRMFQTEHFKKCDTIPYLFGKEYGKDSRPTLPFSLEHHKNMTENFSLDLGDADMLVLKTFKKSKPRALYTLCDIGWLNTEAVDCFYEFLEYYLPKGDFDIIVKHTIYGTEHYCNNIMYSNIEYFHEYWTYVMDIIEIFSRIVEDKIPNKITPRMYGYFAEYLMKPVIEMMGLKVKEIDSICLEHKIK